MAAALDEREQRLIRSERLAAVGKIAAQITHEVRNPLSSIGLNAEMLEEELGALEGPPAQIEEARRWRARSSRRSIGSTEITEEYLRFARLPRPKLEREDLGAIVSSLLRVPAAGAGRARHRRRGAAAADLPPVAADEHQLRQALLNLLRNAAEAMRGGGRLTVRRGASTDELVRADASPTPARASRPSTWPRSSIRSSRPRRAAPASGWRSRSRSSSSTAARSTVDERARPRHHLHRAAARRSPTRAPRRRPRRLLRTAARSKTRRRGRRPRIVRVLLVEDNPHVAELITDGLDGAARRELAGQVAFIFDVVGDGQMALERLAAGRARPDHLDVYMPVMDGAQFLRHLRARPQQRRRR